MSTAEFRRGYGAGKASVQSSKQQDDRIMALVRALDDTRRQLDQAKRDLDFYRHPWSHLWEKLRGEP